MNASPIAPAPDLPLETEELLPLSFAQQRLWFLDQLHPQSPLYNVPLAFRLRGPLRLDALEKSFAALIERHEVLRSVYVYTNDGPAQKVAAQFSFKLDTFDVTEQELPERLRVEAARPFDLAQDLMLRAAVFVLGTEEHVLFLNVHHIAFDEWSEGVLLRELAECYQAFCGGHAPSLGELPIQYADFALWQRDGMSEGRWERQLVYWKNQLAGELPCVELPSDRARGVARNYRGAVATLAFEPAVAAGIKALARTEGLTPHIVLLAAFQTLLHRYSGQEDIIVGTPIAGRSRLETEPLIGFFVNTLALRLNFSGNPTFHEVLARARQASLDAFSNQEVPFEQVVEAVQAERTADQNPLFDVVFSLQNSAALPPHFAGLDMTPIPAHTQTSKFDLTLAIQEGRDTLGAMLEYSTELFSPAAAERILTQFHNLLEGIVADSRRPIALISLLTTAERTKILETWNQTAALYPARTIAELFDEAARRAPLNIAISFGGESLTYHELNERANRLAHFLRKAGVGADVLAGVFLERSVDLFVTWLAILKAGGAYVPLDLEYPNERLAFMINDTQMPVIVTRANLGHILPGSSARVISLDSEAALLAREPATSPSPGTTIDNLAYIIYTSGSTGQPKGVAIPQRGVVRLLFNTNYIDLNAAERIAQISNSSFDAATFEVWGTWLHGGTLVGAPKEVLLEPKKFAQFLKTERITSLFLTTALFNQIAAENPGAFRSVKNLLAGGDALDVKSARRVLAAGRPTRLVNGYGPTESTTFAVCHEILTVPDDAASIPIGRPISNTTLYILDANLQPVPIGVAGELHIGGDGLARGYFNRPELTASRFIPNPFSADPRDRLFKTGDRARYSPEGTVEFLGRLDHQVKIRGFRIELGEIESVIRQYPGVKDTLVVVAAPNPDDKRLLAYVCRERGHDSLTAPLRRFVRRKLPDYMTPSVFIELENFPLTPNGKINRKALPLAPAGHAASTPETAPPVTRLQSQLRLAWEKTLGHSAFGATDNFFEVGGHSLLAVKLIAQMETTTGRRLPVQILFQAPTIEKLVAHLSEEKIPALGSCLVEIQPKGTRAPIFWLHTLGGGGGGGLFTYRNLALALGPEQPSYGFVAPLQPLASIEAMAARYIAEMRQVQPRGPYQLGGYCFGGVVAFEMARQLEGQGEETGLLALLDSSPPDPRGERTRPSAKLALHFARTLPAWLIETARGGPGFVLRKISSAAQGTSRRVRKLASRSAPAPVEPSSDALLEQMVDMTNYPADYKHYARAHWKALMNYAPGPFRGKVVLFKTSEFHPLRLDPVGEWRKLAPGGLEIIPITGKHEEILNEPHVAGLARQIRKFLRPV